MAFTVTKDTIIGDIMDADENTAPYFMEMGMHCLFCPASRGETLEEACAVHGVPVEEMLEKLQQALCRISVWNYFLPPSRLFRGRAAIFSLEESFG